MTDIPRPTPASALGCIVKRYAGSRHAFRWHFQAVQAHLLAPLDNGRDRVRVIGTDIHRSFAQVAILADSGDREQSVHSIMNTDSGDHEHLFAPD
jgi:hypothetical protein